MKLTLASTGSPSPSVSLAVLEKKATLSSLILHCGNFSSLTCTFRARDHSTLTSFLMEPDENTDFVDEGYASTSANSSYVTSIATEIREGIEEYG
ncbi:uncharacterized protein Z520_09378 [Fonsecaea multimorphosa CBS 102226]|uniref:Uncharacterized protein n=1 Tax=Fonsecaea multimorphosa CBS 102226 TaxID=1442371 RepID=A0A0D2KEC7_9EURO|nr:uncharacterized protein Z520_09378 [Fonsecaea multimorphosa CBS 102226]KIX95068.1 hypothetical protein Z520_09378 [Fonsecaea multimorphosa CBS 102226]